MNAQTAPAPDDLDGMVPSLEQSIIGAQTIEITQLRIMLAEARREVKIARREIAQLRADKAAAPEAEAKKAKAG